MTQEITDLTDLKQLHDAMKAAFATAMPVLNTVQAFNPVRREKIQTPAVLIEAGAIKPGQFISGGRLPVTIEFYAHCLLSIQTPNVELEILNLATQTMRLINGNTWQLGEAVSRPAQLSADPGVFKPGEAGWECWVVSWQQTIYLGEVWEPEDFLPTEVWVGEAPNIGADHVDDYDKVTE